MFVYLVYYFWLWWASHCSGSSHRGAQAVEMPASVAVVCALWALVQWLGHTRVVALQHVGVSPDQVSNRCLLSCKVAS